VVWPDFWWRCFGVGRGKGREMERAREGTA